jgi:aspartyl-tRNA(Asn)/glutamyl-tRNA(Gln) amidotransferase subunit B
MSQGSLRCDANVSVRPAGSDMLGTKTELKNMNSFAFLERGVKAEIERQIGLLESGEAVVQETLHFDPRSGRLTPLRSKEEAHDYRYFPEPDLMPLVVSPELIEAARAALPELPAARAERFERELGLPAGRARELAFRTELADYFEAALAANGGSDPVAVANWIPLLIERIGPDIDPATTRVTPAALAVLAGMVAAKEVSRDAAREVLRRMVEEGGDPRAIVEREGLGAIAGDQDGLAEIVDRAIAADPDAAEKVRAGNMKAVGPLVGFVMRETKGRADGGEVTRLIRERLQG